MQVEAVPGPLVGMISLLIDKIVLQQQLPVKIRWLFADNLSFSHDRRPPPSLGTSEAPLPGVRQEQASFSKGFLIILSGPIFIQVTQFHAARPVA
jgi:hypothetical protein